MTDTPKLIDAKALLEGVTASGHWDTDEGREKAEEYAVMSRSDLSYGDKSDLAIANAVFMVNRDDLRLIHFQTAAKERIRWLSVMLAIANRDNTTLTTRAETAEAEVERSKEVLAMVEAAMLNGGDGVVGDFGWNITALNKARPHIRALLKEQGE